MGRIHESIGSISLTGYSIANPTRVAELIVFISLIPIVGYWIAAIPRTAIGRTITWSFVALSVLLVERISAEEPAGTRMLLMIVTLLWSIKSVVYGESRQRGYCELSYWQWLGFCVGWFGMRAELFRKVSAKPLPDWQNAIWRGLQNGCVGTALVFTAWWRVHEASPASVGIDIYRLWTATALLLLGLSLGFHFGLFNLLTGAWRYFGIRCVSLFRAPLRSRSLTEFWGRRWNVAFSEMTALAVYRPLKQLPGTPRRVTVIATIGAFLFSGLLHELAISVPVGAGFGLPMLYFAIHAVGILLERRLTFLESPLAGRLWTATWVLLPLPLLFHRPFLQGCVWPIIGI